MKRLYPLILLMLCYLIPLHAQDAKPGIKFNKRKHDFGDIIEGKHAEYSFIFHNTGNAPLKLTKVRASCGCTTPSWSRGEIAPGDSGFINVIFNSRGYKNKDFAKSIMVNTNILNEKQPKIVVLFITGHVLPKEAAIAQFPVSLSEYKFEWGQVPNKSKVKESFYIKNEGDSTIIIEAFEQAEGHQFKIKIKDMEIAPGDSSEVKIVYKPKGIPPGKYFEKINFISSNIHKKHTRSISKRGAHFIWYIVGDPKK